MKGGAGVCRMTIDGAGGQGNGEAHPLARVPVCSDQRHFKSVTTAHDRPVVPKITVRVKCHSCCKPLLTSIKYKVTHILYVHHQQVYKNRIVCF